MIILDTNVVSEIQKLRFDPVCARWISEQTLGSLFMTARSIAEMAFGGSKTLFRDGSDRYLETLERVIELHFLGRILPFDGRAARINGKLRAERQAAALPAPLIDTQIASICLAHGAALATRNIRDFEGLDLELINPFDPAES